MKDKTITDKHYDFLNELVQILGFKNLADFDTIISYTTLKISQEYICIEFNKLINLFKHLFPLNEFDLRKFNYEFKNIDQIIGFIKKIFTYLSINYDYSRIKGIPNMRLIPQNNIYNNYIIKMREIPQNIKNILTHSTTHNFSMIKIIDTFEKVNVNKKYIIQNLYNLSKINIDWINKIKITFDDDKKLPNNTQISIMINNKEIILHKIENQEQIDNDILINIPNNFLYLHNFVSLKINLPDLYEEYNDFSTNINFLVEFNGYNILNKKSIIDYYHSNCNSFILFDHDKIYSDDKYNLRIFDKFLYIGNDNNNNNNNNNNINSDEYISMKHILTYLKRPFENTYNIDSKFNLYILSNTFDYFYWINIKNNDNTNLSTGIIIQLIIGDNVILENIIDTNTIFDENNYFKFHIDIPNNIFYKYQGATLNIKNNTNKNTYNVIISGSKFKSTLPKKIINSKIVYDHDIKWYTDNNNKHISYNGFFGTTVTTKKQNSDNDIINEFIKYEKQNKIISGIFQLNSDINDNFIFIDNQEQTINSLYFLYCNKFNEYIKSTNILNKNISSFSFGTNILKNNTKYSLCEVHDSYNLLYYEISNDGDLIKHIDIYFNSDINYDINAYLQYCDKNNYINSDLDIIKYTNKIRFQFNNKLINLVNIPKLFIKIPSDKLSNWNNINLSIGYIFSENDIRKQLYTTLLNPIIV